MDARITDIEKCSLYDGPGIRTVVFFAGCNMRCMWCQNPETQAHKSKLMIDSNLCIGCGACAKVCAYQACVHDGSALCVRAENCRQCFCCTQVCLPQARRCSIQKVTLDELLETLLDDIVFYRNSGGGVTLSGGEAPLQTAACKHLLTQLRQHGVHTALETAGYYPQNILEQLINDVDLFLFDLKCIDREKHMHFTGVDNAQILENFALVARSRPIILRIALIPGVNDGSEFEAIIDFATTFPAIAEVHILPFHQFGDSKYAQLSVPYAFQDRELNTGEALEQCRAYAAAKGLNVSVGGAGFSRKE